jgi:exopolysaccharide biosynthesis protein
VTIPQYRDAAHPAATLEPGGPNDYSNARAWTEVATARTAIGLSRDRRILTLFTADVRGGSEGMRLGEVAGILVAEYSVWDALNLDGGGSTSMALADPVTGRAQLVNTSSDNPDGREVATSLAVFAPKAPR